jgi:hypothetical protein
VIITKYYGLPRERSSRLRKGDVGDVGDVSRDSNLPRVM